MPTNVTPSLPTQQTVLPPRTPRFVVRTVDQGAKPVDPQELAAQINRLYRHVADTTDALLSWVNGAFSPTPATKMTTASAGAPGSTVNRALQPQTSQTATNNPQDLVTRGAVTATTVTSAAGFKCFVGPITYYSGTYPGGIIQLGVAAANGTAVVFFDSPSYGWVAPAAGSIIGVSARGYSSTATTLQVYAGKNGATFGPSANASCAAGAHVSIQTLGIAKGTYTFGAGDTLGATGGASTSGQVMALQASLIVELAA